MNITTNQNLIDDITKYSVSLGFENIGFCYPKVSKQNAEHLQKIVWQKKFGTMSWLAKSVEKRLKPKLLWTKVQTVICLTSNYYSSEFNSLDKKLSDKSQAVISNYANSNDYHFTIRENLILIQEFLKNNYNLNSKVYVDTAPVLEKHFCHQAGLGWQGKHTNLVSKDFGSWLFLSCIYLDYDLELKEKHSNQYNTKLPTCGSCQKCIEACPTDALDIPYQLKIESCLAYLLIEHKGIIPKRFYKKIGNRLFGCDDCLSVCPWNKFAKNAASINFHTRHDLNNLKLDDLVKLDESGYKKLFDNTPVMRLKYHRFVRNLLIVIGNSGNRKYINYILAKKREFQNEAAVLDAASFALNQLS